MRSLKKHFLLILICFPCVVFGKDLGVIGQTYPIAEEDFLQAIQHEMQQKIQSGEWAQWQAQQTAEVERYTDRPVPVSGLTPATETRTWLYDPSITVPYEVRDNQNKLILAAGSRFNPLDTLNWNTALIFYDGDNPQQVAWVEQMNQQLKAVTLILVNGSLSQQSNRFKKRIYFDQGGHLVNRLNITHTPALVEQTGKQLKITEFKQ